MTKKLYLSAYFTNIVKVTILFVQQDNKNLTAKEIAGKLNLSHNYIFQTTKAMKALTLLEGHAGKYLLTTNGLLFAEYLQKKDANELKKLGELIINKFDSENARIWKNAINKLQVNPNITDSDLGYFIAKEFQTTWETSGTYQRVGGSLKSILYGFHLVGEKNQSFLTATIPIIPNKSIVEVLAFLHKDINTFIHMILEDNNAWKNHIELRQKIEKTFDELTKNQYAVASQLLLRESKKWFMEGVNKKDIDLIRHSLNLLIKIEINNLLK